MTDDSNATDTPAARPRRGRPARASTTTTRGSRRTPAADDLSAQVDRLQEDLNATIAALANLSGRKVNEVKDEAQERYFDLVHRGERAVADLGDQAGELETQLKRVIRDKPLTAVAGALAIGFVVALLTR